MKNPLQNISILYLDDSDDQLRHTSDFFKDMGISISTTQSIEEVVNKTNLAKIDIFISDLKLDNISDVPRGSTILNAIRNTNKHIFLALLTAYKLDLSNEETSTLNKNNIKIYQKGDSETFFLNLQNDYLDFIKYNITPPTSVFDSFKKGVVNTLKKISNQEALVYVKNIGNYKVNDLINEVLNDTVVGQNFIENWLETLEYINEVKKKTT